MKYEERAAFEQADAFGIGAPNDAYAQYFVGDSFLHPLTDPKECPGENCSNEWCEPVTDEQYNSAKIERF